MTVFTYSYIRHMHVQYDDIIRIHDSYGVVK